MSRLLYLPDDVYSSHDEHGSNFRVRFVRRITSTAPPALQP